MLSEVRCCLELSVRTSFFIVPVSVKAILEAQLKDRLKTLVVRRIDGTRHLTF